MARTSHSFGPAAIVSTSPELADQPVAVALLDLIGRTEAPGGYNQRYGEPNSGPFGTDLINLTVNQVLALPMRRLGGRSFSAAGRYQILRATLEDIKRGMGLTGSEVFDPAMQDKMALYLLKRRGYDSWLRGDLSDIDFGNNIAREWASFPVLARTQGQKRAVDRGQSFYAGDGINKALVRPEAVEAALGARRAPTTPRPPAPRPTVSPSDIAGSIAGGGSGFGISEVIGLPLWASITIGLALGAGVLFAFIKAKGK